MLSGGFANLCLWLSNRRNNKEKNQPWKASLPEAGWHPSNPVVERSWDAIFCFAMKKNATRIEFLRVVTILSHNNEGTIAQIISCQILKIQIYGNNN